MRARFATRASTVPARVHDSRIERSPLRSFNGGSRMRTWNHISVTYAVIH